MKKHLSTIVTVLALAIAVISQFRISNLQGEIRQMENRLNSSISNVQSNQSNAIAYMQQLMEKEASILTHTDFSLGELDLANKTFVFSLHYILYYYPNNGKYVVSQFNSLSI